MFRDVTTEKLLYSNKYIAEKHPDFYKLYTLPLIHLLNANGPGYLYDNPTFATKITVTNKPQNVWLGKLKAVIKRNEPLKRLALKILKIKSKR